MAIVKTDVGTREGNTEDFCSAKNCLLKYLGGHQIRALPEGVHQPKVLQRGQRLIVQGAKFRSFYQVRSGSFKSCFTGSYGDWHVTGFHYPGDIIGLDGLESGQHAYQIEALETSSVCGLPFDTIERLLKADVGGFYRRLISTLSSTEYSRYHSLMRMSKMRADQRLARFILDVSQRMHAQHVSALEFDLNMARYDIANYLGLAVETLSRLFKRFQEEQLVFVRRQSLKILDLTALQALAADEAEAETGVSKIPAGLSSALRTERDFAFDTGLRRSA